MKTLHQHESDIHQIARHIKEYSLTKHTKKLRFFHGSTNSTRMQRNDEYVWIDISRLGDIIEVNTSEKFVLCEPNVSMSTLVKTTLMYNLLPHVVMEFPGITVGGGINGAALESSSYKYGQFCDTCEEYEILLGNGKIITANAQKNADIFYGISGSYGTLGLLSLIKVKLIPAAPFVHVTYYPAKSYKHTLSVINAHIQKNESHFIEGIIFNPEESAVITGKLVHESTLPVQTYTKARDPWFYETGKKTAKNQVKHEELIPIVDYLFRYNRGAFWMGEYIFPLFHTPNNKITRYLFNPLINTRKLYDGLHATNISQDYFIQDFYVPFDKAEKFIQYSEKKVGIFPLWLCPVKPAKKPQKLSPDYIKTPQLLDIGIWGQTKKYLANPIGINREFEDYAKKHTVRKMLYAHAYYTEDEFWNVYDKKWYDSIRTKYYSQKVFPTIWQKVRVYEKYKIHKWSGILKILGETLEFKHINILP